MKLALFTSNVHEQHLPYKVYGKVDFHFNKSESKDNKKKKSPKIATQIAEIFEEVYKHVYIYKSYYMYAEYYKDIFTALCAVMQASLYF